MIFRAMTIDNKPFYFDVTDVPTDINSKYTILVRRPGTPLLYTRSIVRGPDSKEFFESDFVLQKEDNRFIGYVVYIDGFYIWSAKDKSITPLRDSSKYTFAFNIMLYKISDLYSVRSPINFIHDGRMFKLGRIMYGNDRELFIDLKSSRKPALLEEVRLCTGVGRDGVEFYYGQCLDDGVIVYNDYHPMVQMFGDNTYRELESKDYDKLGIT